MKVWFQIYNMHSDKLNVDGLDTLCLSGEWPVQLSPPCPSNAVIRVQFAATETQPSLAAPPT